MLTGINAGFGQLLDPAELADLRAFGVSLVRDEIAPGATDAQIEAQLAEFVGQPFVPLILLFGGLGLPVNTTPAICAALTTRVLRAAETVGLRDVWLEVGNEPDIGWSATRPTVFAECCLAVHQTARAAGFTGPIVSGGVSTTDTRGRRYLQAMRWETLPADLLVGLHRYAPQMSPTMTFAGFATRDQELAAVRAVTAGHRLAHTEGGYHTRRETARSGFKTTTIQLTDEEAAAALVQELDFWARQPDVACCCLYQWGDDATRFGVRDEQHVWKLQAFAVRDWIASQAQVTPYHVAVSDAVTGAGLAATGSLHPDDNSGDIPSRVVSPTQVGFSVAFPPATLGWGATIAVQAQGYHPGMLRLVLEAASDPIDLALALEPKVMIVLRSVPPPLVVVGEFFETAADRLVIIGCSDFVLFERFVKEGADAIRPVLDERATLGFTQLRVLTTYKGTLGDFDGRPHMDQLAPFCALVGGYGLRLELTAWADTQRIEPSPVRQLEWVVALHAAVAHFPHVTIEGVNEEGVHDNSAPGLNVSSPIAGICSHGAARVAPGNWGTAQPVWRYATYHPDRTSDWPRKVGHNAMEVANQFHVPCVSNETTRPDQDGFHPSHFFDAAANASLLCAGATFHCDAGKKSIQMSPQERACAEAWVAGARAVPLDYRTGEYANAHSSRAPIEHRDAWSAATHSMIVGHTACSQVSQRTASWQLVPRGSWRVVRQDAGVVELIR